MPETVYIQVCKQFANILIKNICGRGVTWESSVFPSPVASESMTLNVVVLFKTKETMCSSTISVRIK